MKKKSVIFVESPLQILCANELINARDHDFSLVLRLNGGRVNDQSMISVAKDLRVEYKILMLEKGKFLKSIFRLANLKVICWFLFSRFDLLVSGDYFSKPINLLINIKRKVSKFTLLYVDDGVGTFLSQADMLKRKNPSDIFTMLSVDPLPSQMVYRHTFENFKKRIVIERSGGVYFIGQKLVEAGFCSIDKYVALVEKAQLLKAVDVLLYVPHRGESEETLEKIRKLNNVRVVNVDGCIELYFSRIRTTPAVVMSFFSTALFTLPLMYPSAKYVSIFSNDVNYRRVSHGPTIMEALRSSDNVRVIEFNS